jgi:hypothetical protein
MSTSAAPNGKCDKCGTETIGRLHSGPPAPYGVTPPFYVPSCNGNLPPGCQTAFTVQNTVAIPPGGTIQIDFGPYQALQLIDIILVTEETINQGDVILEDIQFNETSVIPKGKSDSGSYRKIVSDVVRYTDEATRSGTTPLTSAIPLSDKTNQLQYIFRNQTAAPIAVGVLQVELHYRAPSLWECGMGDAENNENGQKLMSCATDAGMKQMLAINAIMQQLGKGCG